MKATALILCAAALASCGSTSQGSGDGVPLESGRDGPLEGQAQATSPILAERVMAPDFVLFDQEGFPFPLVESRDKWLVLHFFPESDTPDCACDATAFTGHLWRFNDMSAEVACVTSATRDRTLLYAKKYGLRSPLLSDADLAVAAQYGALREGATVEGPHSPDALVRTTAIIDPEGRIAARWDDVKSNEHVEDLLATLRILRER